MITPVNKGGAWNGYDGLVFQAAQGDDLTLDTGLLPRAAKLHAELIDAAGVTGHLGEEFERDLGLVGRGFRELGLDGNIGLFVEAHLLGLPYRIAENGFLLPLTLFGGCLRRCSFGLGLGYRGAVDAASGFDYTAEVRPQSGRFVD